jgi:maltooligosyltrehalose trehalohydrolase
MAKVGHFYNTAGQSAFRIFAPQKQQVAVVLLPQQARVALEPDAFGYWSGETARLPEGTRYLIELDGRSVPDLASRSQPEGVHAPSAIAEPHTVRSAGWQGVRIEDAVIYELHLGTFTPEGTLAGAMQKLPHLAELGITVIELLPIAAFPGHRNWGYDGVYHFALQHDYGSYRDLKRFIERAHELKMAVVLDVVYNHFGPEGNYSAVYAPFTRSAATPWGAAINLDHAWNHGVREFFLENVRYWLEEVGFDGFRMDAVAMIFDGMPVHILRQFTDLARRIGEAEGREVLMIAEHLRNNKYVTSATGFNFHAQWNDDVNHAVFARLTGETGRHYDNFGSFADVVTSLAKGFVLDGTRFCKHHRYLIGTDGSDTHGREHVVHIQNHDQVGNRLRGDRLIATYGREKALLGITAVLASPFVPMLFMGEEYGETAPFLFFEDFSDQHIVDGAREGRKADYAFGGVEPEDPHALSTFERSKLRWERAETPSGQAILDYYKQLIALKRSGELGPRERSAVTVTADDRTEVIHVETPHTLTVMNFSSEPRTLAVGQGWAFCLGSAVADEGGGLNAFGTAVYRRTPAA